MRLDYQILLTPPLDLLSGSALAYHNTSNCLPNVQHLKTASSNFTTARYALLGTYTAQIHPPPLNAACFVLVTAL